MRWKLFTEILDSRTGTLRVGIHNKRSSGMKLQKLVLTHLAACAALALGGVAMAQDIEMAIGGKVYTITLEENDAAKALAARLPIKLQFEDFGAVERIAYLNPKLDVGNAPTRTTPKTGDLTYYMPWGNLAAFTGNFRSCESLVPLGRMSTEAIRALRDSGSADVTLRRKE